MPLSLRHAFGVTRFQGSALNLAEARSARRRIPLAVQTATIARGIAIALPRAFAGKDVEKAATRPALLRGRQSLRRRLGSRNRRDLLHDLSLRLLVVGN